MKTLLWLYIYAVIFIAGLCVGSFMNVLIYRIPRKINTVKGRSFCPDCGHKLCWLDLFPVFSYVFLGGKCRYCHKPISPRYAAVELLNAILWLLYAFRYIYHPLTMVAFFMFGSALICIIFTDAEHMLIFDRFNIVIALSGLIVCTEYFYCSCQFTTTLTHWDRLIGVFVVSVPFLLIALISGGRAMGGGDIKLTAAAGLMLGWKSMLMMLFVACITGTIGSVIMSIINKKRSVPVEKTDIIEDAESDGEQIGHAIPFGPYLAGSMIIMSFFGDQLVGLYLKLCGF